MKKICSRCYHELPHGKSTWRPRWSWWPGSVNGVESNREHETLVYASDGPALGAIGKPVGSARFSSYVLAAVPQDGKAWPEQKCLGSFRRLCDAKRAVERVVRTNNLWP